MKLALIGYGKMGKEVERVAKERGLDVVALFKKAGGLTKASLKSVDVCIDFSSPGGLLDTVDAVGRCGKNIVVGTTGWQDRVDDVKRLVKEHGMGLLYSSNFSPGVNIFSQIVMDAAHMFDGYAEYDVAISEMHHKGKTDSPSGTALSLGSLILHEIKRKKELLTDSSRGKIKPHQLHIASTRAGHVTGKHTVIFDSEADTIELVHTAKSRRGFAVGAVVAAEWLKGKKGLYTMRDVIMANL